MSDADFIIVGAGSAGCVLASEICRRELDKVLLVETGSLPCSRHLKVPSEYPLAFQGKHAWQHATVPQPQLANRKMQLPAGRTLGGSSALNAMIYLRGHPTDFDQWTMVAGSDWERNGVANAFEAIESAMQIEQMDAPELHPALQMFMSCASSALGPSTIPTFREPTFGLGNYLRCQSNGRRKSAWDLWMKTPMRDSHASKWLEVLSNALVQRLVFSGERVSGVILANSQSPRNATHVAARKGVILCSGAIRSPQLLLASGVGNSSELAELGIECRVDLPNVGKNFQDHLVFPIVFATPKHKSLSYPMSHADRLQYAKHRTGPRASNIAEAGGFFSLPSKHNPSDGGHGNSLDFQWHLTPTHYLEYPNKQEPTNAMTIAVCLSRPSSRGCVRLRRANENDSPERFELEIMPEYLSTSSDMEEFFEAIQWTRSIGQSGAFSELFHNELLPGPKRQSREQVMSAIARFATTLYHYAGTCAMGQPSSGVVDSRFRVHGVEGLWVCDASSMPSLVSGNTQATVMMMAYRLAEWLEK